MLSAMQAFKEGYKIFFLFQMLNDSSDNFLPMN